MGLDGAVLTWTTGTDSLAERISLQAGAVRFNFGTRGALPRSRERVVILGRTDLLNGV